MKEETKIATREHDSSITEEFCEAETNKVFIKGKIIENFEFDHSAYGEDFYHSSVSIERLSEVCDIIPIIVSEQLLNKEQLNNSVQNKWIEATGQIRTYSIAGDDGRKHLKVLVFVTEIRIYDEEEGEELKYANVIYLDGLLCKPPIFRKTPLGRQITDLIIAVNRDHNKSDYIPSIVWGREAQLAGGFEIGDRVKIFGRIQSREYFKRNSPDSEEGEYRTAYEVSIKRVQRKED